MKHDQEVRYSRQMILPGVGKAGQEKLLNAKVLVIGAGGLGSPLLLYLAAAGIGTIGIIDDDRVELHNLQRQIIHETASVGDAKVDSARESLIDLNPEIKIHCHQKRLTESNAYDIIKEYDIVADGSDNFMTRFLVNDKCYKLKKTLVSAAILRFEGQLSTFRAHEVEENLPCYRCIYPDVPPEGTAPRCSEAGILGSVAGVMGCWQATEVLKEILGVGKSLAGSLLVFDALSAASRTIAVSPDPECQCCGVDHKAI